MNHETDARQDRPGKTGDAMTHAEVAAVLEEYGLEVAPENEVTVTDWVETFRVSVFQPVLMMVLSAFVVLWAVFSIHGWGKPGSLGFDNADFWIPANLVFATVLSLLPFWGAATFRKEYVEEEPGEYPTVYRTHYRRLVFWKDLANATWAAKPFVMFNILLRWASVLVTLGGVLWIGMYWYLWLTDQLF